MSNGKRRYKSKIKISQESNKTSTIENMDKIISNIKSTNKNNFRKSINPNLAISVGLLALIIFSGGIIVLNSPTRSSNNPIVPLDKELPPNMIDKNDRNILSAENTIIAYNYAKSNDNILEHLKCYCGCDNIHNNNRECFWKANGEKDTHAQTCGVCIYIALSAKQLNEAGWTTPEIRQYIDSQFL